MAPRVYYHGTFSGAAIASLLDGGSLEPMRPAGRSAFASAEKGLVHLTPAFVQAVEYGFMKGRSDWPDEGFVAASVPHVFGFEDLDATLMLPDEDELGLAVKRSVCILRGSGCSSGFNIAFAEGLDADAGLRADLLSAAADVVAKTKGDPQWWTGAVQAKVGRSLRRTIGPELVARLVECGISVATRERPVPVAAWALPKRVFEADDADPVFDRRAATAPAF